MLEGSSEEVHVLLKGEGCSRQREHVCGGRALDQQGGDRLSRVRAALGTQLLTSWLPPGGQGPKREDVVKAVPAGPVVATWPPSLTLQLQPRALVPETWALAGGLTVENQGEEASLRSLNTGCAPRAPAHHLPSNLIFTPSSCCPGLPRPPPAPQHLDGAWTVEMQGV